MIIKNNRYSSLPLLSHLVSKFRTLIGFSFFFFGTHFVGKILLLPPDNIIEMIVNILIIAVSFVSSILLPWVIYKNIIDRFFSILYLRKFDKEPAGDAHKNILPDLGFYGKVTTVSDDNLHDQRTVSSVNNVLRMIHSTFSGDNFITSEDWKSDVRKLIKSNDCVVIDFRIPSDPLEWELKTALSHFQKNRIGVIYDETNSTADFLRNLTQESKKFFTIQVSRDKPLTDIKSQIYRFMVNMRNEH